MARRAPGSRDPGRAFDSRSRLGSSPMRLRRPFALGSTLGALAHHGFETRAGVGLVFEPQLGPARRPSRSGPPSSRLMALTPLCAAGAPHERLSAHKRGDRRRRGRRPLRRVALVAARRRADARGSRGPERGATPRLQRGALVLGLCSALSLFREADRAPARLGLIAAAMNFPCLLISARHHFRWAREQASSQPERWSPALRDRERRALARPRSGRRSASASTTSARRPKLSSASAPAAPNWEPPDGDREPARHPRRARRRRLLSQPSSSRGSMPSSTRTPCGEINSGGHEVAFHAWRHEEWAELVPGRAARRTSPAAPRAFAGARALDRGHAPPGGRPRRRGARGAARCRACATARRRDAAGSASRAAVALLPFRLAPCRCQLRAAGAGPVREQIRGHWRRLEPARLPRLPRAASSRQLTAQGGFLAIVLHPFMLDWLGEARLANLLDASRRRSAAELWARWSRRSLGQLQSRRLSRRRLAGRDQLSPEAARFVPPFPRSETSRRPRRRRSPGGDPSAVLRSPRGDLPTRRERRGRAARARTAATVWRSVSRASWWGIQCRRPARLGGVHQNRPAKGLDPGELIGQAIGHVGQQLGGRPDRQPRRRDRVPAQLVGELGDGQLTGAGEVVDARLAAADNGGRKAPRRRRPDGRAGRGRRDRAGPGAATASCRAPSAAAPGPSARVRPAESCRAAASPQGRRRCRDERRRPRYSLADRRIGKLASTSALCAEYGWRLVPRTGRSSVRSSGMSA